MGKEALAGLRVLDLTQYVAGPYCTKLMADYGAEVIKVERPVSGDGARRLGPFPGDIPHPEKSGLFLFLNTNKQGITLDLKSDSGANTLRQLASQVDILVESFRPGTMDRLGLGYVALSRLNPRLVMCSISNFGQTGPYRDYKATEMVFQAMSGFMYGCGEPQREPLWVPLYIAQQVAGLYAFIVSLAAENYSSVSGRGLYTKVSILEAGLELLDLAVEAHLYSGETRERVGYRRKATYPGHILPCKEGHVAMCGVTLREWQDLVKLLGRPELGDDPGLRTGPDRTARADELDAIFLPWLAEHTSEEIYRSAQGVRVPFAMVSSGAEIGQSKQLNARGFFREVEYPMLGKLTYPGAPFPMPETPPRPMRSAPFLGQENEKLHPGGSLFSSIGLAPLASNSHRKTGRDVPRLPLEGVRIADLTQVWAGPKCTQILGDLGAEIIKIEAPRRSDPVRGATIINPGWYPHGHRGAKPHNRSGYFHCLNRNKYGITLDLRTGTGVELFKRLVAISHVVIDNFSANVMQRLGLGHEVLKSVNPDIVQVSMSGFGSYGPDANYVAWADTIEALAGLSYITGYLGGPPMCSSQAPSDPVAGVFGAVAVLTALRHQRETGEGRYIDFSQLEALTSLNVEPLMDWVMNGRIRGRQGNLHSGMAPHGCYPCLGKDAWVTITVCNDEEWERFCQALGSPQWAKDGCLSSLSGRLEHRDELDGHIGEWTRQLTPRQVEAILQGFGVPAGAVLNVEEIAHDPHLKERGVFEEIDHPEVGPYPYYQAMSARFPGLALKTRRPAPCFGQDNHYVLRELLGVPEEEIAELEDRQIIASEPLETVLIQAADSEKHDAA